MEFAFIVEKLSTWKETVPASTADSMLSKLDKQDTKESNCQTLKKQGCIVLQNFCFTEKSDMPVGQRCIPQHLRGP